MRGDLALESTEGVGSIFTLVLPTTPETSGAAGITACAVGTDDSPYAPALAS
jgi:chemotaxis protein histidine kinase CheA